MELNEKTAVHNRKLLTSTGYVSFFTLLSRILGLLRDITLVMIFPVATTVGLDAFFVALRAPNFFRRIFAEGAFTNAFVPVFLEYKSKNNPEELKMLVRRVSGTLGWILLIISLLAMIFAPWISWVFAPGFSDDPEKLKLTGDLTRITFPYLFFISMWALGGSILNSYHHFTMPAFTPVLLNICLIAAAIWGAEFFQHGVTALAWAVSFSGVLQLLFLLPSLKKRGMLLRPIWSPKDKGVIEIVKLMIPTLLSVSVGQINLLLNMILASFLVAGSVSWLFLSDRLMQLPLGIFGIAIGTVILPALSQKFSGRKTEDFSLTLNWGLKLVLLIGLPASLALIVLAEPVVATLFHRGEFQPYDVIQSAKSLRAYALGLLAFMLVKVLSPGYFARKNTSTPMKCAIASLVINMVLSLLLVIPFAHVGLALSASFAAIINAILLLYGLIRLRLIVLVGFVKYSLQLLIANSVLVIGLLSLMPAADLWFYGSELNRIAVLAAQVIFGIFGYFLVLWILGVRINDFRLKEV